MTKHYCDVCNREVSNETDLNIDGVYSVPVNLNRDNKYDLLTQEVNKIGFYTNGEGIAIPPSSTIDINVNATHGGFYGTNHLGRLLGRTVAKIAVLGSGNPKQLYKIWRHWNIAGFRRLCPLQHSAMVSQ